MIASSGAHGRQVQDRAGAGQQEKRPAIRPAAAQMGDQGLLGGLVQPLFDHVDNEDGRTFGLNPASRAISAFDTVAPSSTSQASA